MNVQGINAKGEYITSDWAVLMNGRVLRARLTEWQAREIAARFPGSEVRRMN